MEGHLATCITRGLGHRRHLAREGHCSSRAWEPQRAGTAGRTRVSRSLVELSKFLGACEPPPLRRVCAHGSGKENHRYRSGPPHDYVLKIVSGLHGIQLQTLFSTNMCLHVAHVSASKARFRSILTSSLNSSATCPCLLKTSLSESSLGKSKNGPAIG